jgi:hypothetical protein
MTTLAFLNETLLHFGMVVVLVVGALLWRLIWAILVTPRLNQIPPLFGQKDSAEPRAETRVRIRESLPEPEPEYVSIEVITPREALPIRQTPEGISRPALSDGNRNLVRRRPQ